MKGQKEIIALLNQVLKNELTAINQYFLHSRMFRNFGFSRLAELEHKESMDEMKHADQLIERILFLEGLPNLQDIGKLRLGEDVPEMLRADLALEMDGLPLLREAIASCEAQADFVTRDLLQGILTSEEEHVDWLETQLGLLERLGLENYQQTNV